MPLYIFSPCFSSSVSFILSIARDLVHIYDGVLRSAAVVGRNDHDDDDDKDDGDENDHREASYTYWMIIILMNTRRQ